MRSPRTDDSLARDMVYSFGLYVLDPVKGTLVRDSIRMRVQEQRFEGGDSESTLAAKYLCRIRQELGSGGTEGSRSSWG